MGGAGGFWLTTFLFLGLEGVLFAYVRATGVRGTNQLRHALAATTVICMWMMWSIVYLAQMNPLIVPVLNKEEDNNEE